MRRSQRLGTLLVIMGWLAGCAVGPDYKRPEVLTPADWRSVTEGRDSVGDLGWWELFKDPTLHELISAAVVANRDVQIAVARVLDSRAQLGVARAAQFPQVNASGSYQYTRPFSKNSPMLQGGEIFTGDDWQAGMDLTFELDLWGRLRRGTEAARAELLASEETRRVVLMTLVADVARTHFDLLELDDELEIARRTLQTRQPSLAGLRSTGNACRRRCRRGYRRRCSSAGPTFARPSKRSSPPTRGSVWPKRNTSPRSRSPASSASRACRCPTSLPVGHGFGRSVPP